MLTTFNLGQFPRRAKLRRPDIGFVPVTNGSHATAVSHDIGNWHKPVKEPAIAARGYTFVSGQLAVKQCKRTASNWAEAAGKNWFIQDERFIGDAGASRRTHREHTSEQRHTPLSPACVSRVLHVRTNSSVPREFTQRCAAFVARRCSRIIYTTACCNFLSNVSAKKNRLSLTDTGDALDSRRVRICPLTGIDFQIVLPTRCFRYEFIWELIATGVIFWKTVSLDDKPDDIGSVLTTSSWSLSSTCHKQKYKMTVWKEERSFSIISQTREVSKIQPVSTAK